MTGLLHTRIYLDYNATTPIDPRVIDVVTRHMVDVFGNASSVDHAFGDAAAEAVAEAAAKVATLVGSRAESVVFTSGSTEGANIALRGFCMTMKEDARRPARIALMPSEHSAVLATCVDLQRTGFARLAWLNVDREARADLDQLESVCRAGVDLVVLMAANNEVGTVYPIREAALIAHRHGALFFSDATQAAGKLPIRADEWGIDMLALSAHKIYGPKGVGALIVAGGLRLDAVTTGGGQQRRLRPGTLNVPGIAGLGEACLLRSQEMASDEARHQTLRDGLQDDLLERVPGLVVNGRRDCRLPGTLHVSFPGVPSQAILTRLRHRLALSTGAACSSGIEAPSHVLRAMGLEERVQAGAVRISLGKFTTEVEVRAAAEMLSEAEQVVRSQLNS